MASGIGRRSVPCARDPARDGSAEDRHHHVCHQGQYPTDNERAQRKRKRSQLVSKQWQGRRDLILQELHGLPVVILEERWSLAVDAKAAGGRGRVVEAAA
jgi:hypothetical protein